MNNMEYSFLKELEPSLGFMFEQSTHPLLTPYPKLDFVNPGLGHIVRIHNFMVPLSAKDTLHSIEKQIEDTNQIGSGEQETNEINESEEDQNLIRSQIQQNPDELNLKRKKLLGESVQSSFLHPKKIKINELILKGGSLDNSEKQISKPITKKMKTISHKFKFE